MARVTIEDCLQVMPSRFDLVLMAAKRANQLKSGSMPLVEEGNEKAPLVSLREIAAGYTFDDSTLNQFGDDASRL